MTALEAPAPDSRLPGRTSWSAADSVAALATGVGVALILQVGRSAYLRGDDWVLLSIVSRSGFGPSDLLMPYGNHLMPFGLAAFWLARTFGGPTPWWPLVGMGIATACIGLTFTWMCIRMVVGPRMKAVVPFLVAAWSPSLMAAVMWPSPSVYMTPLFAVTAVCLWGYLRLQVAGRRSGQVVIVLGVTMGLLASELTLLVPGLLFVLGVAWFHTGGMRYAVRRTWFASRSLWVLLVALMAAYSAVYYVLSTYSQTLPSQRASLDAVIESLLLVAVQTLPAMVLGGPWIWSDSMSPAGALTGALALGMALAGWVVILQARRAKWRVWWPLIAILLLTVLALSAGRVATFGPGVVRNPYYVLGATSLLAITLAVAYLPSTLPIDCPQRRPPSARICWAAALALAVSVPVAFAAYASSVPRAPSRDYLANARDALGQPTLNVTSPRQVFGVFIYDDPWDTSQHTFDFVGVPGRWIAVSPHPYMLDDAGRLVPLTVTGEDFAIPGRCIRVDGAESLRMPEGRQPNWPAFALSYRATRPSTGTIELADADIPIAFVPGVHTVYFTGDGRPNSFVLRAEGVCVSRVVVGTAVPSG